MAVQVCLGASLASRNEPAVSHVTERGDLVHSLAWWDKLLVQSEIQMLS